MEKDTQKEKAAATPVPVELDRALTVEVLGGLVAVEVLEYRRKCVAAVEDLRGFGALAVHVDDEVGVLREECLLSLGETAIGAMRVRVHELADREAVRLLGRCDFGDGGHGLRGLFGCRSIVGSE